MGHPDVAMMVYRAFSKSVLGRLVTTMMLVEHAVAHLHFDHLCAIIRMALTDTIKKGSSPHASCHGKPDTAVGPTSTVPRHVHGTVTAFTATAV